MAGLGPTAVAGAVNLCKCGHDANFHVAGTCVLCHGGAGNAHTFTPDGQVTGVGAPFANSDPAGYVISGSGPAGRPPNGQRAG